MTDDAEAASKRATRALPLDPDALRALIPALGSAGLAQAAADAPPREGRVLKLRLGFNPNSSSVGTTVVVFVWSMVASGAAFALVAGVLAHRFARERPPGEGAAPAGAGPA